MLLAFLRRRKLRKMNELSKVKNALFVFDEGMLKVSDMSREQLIQALEWTLEAAEQNKKIADKFSELLDLRKNRKG
jgi:hypothetical protein